MVPSACLDERIKGDREYGSSLWKPLSEECMEWLETKPSQSVVYVSFGSMVRASEQKKLPGWFLHLNKDKGMVVTWCNQLEMLSHPVVGCFVTHCGWNFTLEGLSLGVPKWADQLMDAKFVEDIWGIGVRAEEDEEGVVREGRADQVLEGSDGRGEE
ncbi:hypothetical protein V6N13_105663 [Hibiscus sabdariffa]|uniref:Uncharacterized protein n=1 Tax=Hibiscus sabdariffa TaxID=183260 RepID=A0ABR2EYC6_9ROSI